MKDKLQKRIDKCTEFVESHRYLDKPRVIAELGKPFFREYLRNPTLTQLGDNVWISDEQDKQMLNVNEWQEIFIYVKTGEGYNSKKWNV